MSCRPAADRDAPRPRSPCTAWAARTCPPTSGTWSPAGSAAAWPGSAPGPTSSTCTWTAPTSSRTGGGWAPRPRRSSRAWPRRGRSCTATPTRRTACRAASGSSRRRRRPRATATTPPPACSAARCSPGPTAPRTGPPRSTSTPALPVVTCVPEEVLLTEVARSLLPATVPHADAAFTGARTGLLVQALRGRTDLLLPATEDRIHQQQRAGAMPRSHALMTRLRAAGVAACVSGAGPSLLCLGAGARGRRRARRRRAGWCGRTPSVPRPPCPPCGSDPARRPRSRLTWGPGATVLSTAGSLGPRTTPSCSSREPVQGTRSPVPRRHRAAPPRAAL